MPQQHDPNRQAMSWYNYRTQQFDSLWESPATDEQVKDYLPQYPAAQGLFRVYRAQGYSILEAMKRPYRTLSLPHLHRKDSPEHDTSIP